MTPDLLDVVVVGYAVVGLVVGWRSHRLSLAGRVGAAAAWPVFLPLLASDRPPRRGPHADRVAAVFVALERTLADPAAAEVPWTADLGGLRAALERADERIGLVDRLLVDAPDAPALREARDRAAAELAGVLDEVVQLRLQVGLAALHGNASAVRERLGELLARVEAIEEIDAMRRPGAA